MKMSVRLSSRKEKEKEEKENDDCVHRVNFDPKMLKASYPLTRPLKQENWRHK